MPKAGEPISLRSGGIESVSTELCGTQSRMLPESLSCLTLMKLNALLTSPASLAARARNVYLNLPVVIVVVVRAYEAWFHRQR